MMGNPMMGQPQGGMMGMQMQPQMGMGQPQMGMGQPQMGMNNAPMGGGYGGAPFPGMNQGMPNAMAGPGMMGGPGMSGPGSAFGFIGGGGPGAPGAQAPMMATPDIPA